MSGNNDLGNILLMQSMLGANQGGRSGGLDDILRLQAMQQATSDDPAQRQMAMHTMMTASMLSSMDQEEEDRRRREAAEIERRRQEAELRRQQEELRRQQEALARQQQFDSLMSQGGGFAGANQYEQAAERFEQALAIFSDNVMAKFNRAVCWEKLGNLKDAYEEFLALSGHTSEVPDLLSHISRCEDGLVEFCNNLRTQAQTACEHQDFNTAKEQLRKIKTFAPTRTKHRKELEQFADELLDHIEWISQQDKVIHKFAEANRLLQEGKYELALQRLNNCTDAFTRYSRFLTPEQQEASKSLPALIATARRGVEIQNNIELQLAINDLKDKLNIAILGFNYENAIGISAAMLEKCRLITVPQDVVAQGYIADEIILKDHNTLVDLGKAFKQRRKDVPEQKANNIIEGLVTKGFELLRTDLVMIHDTIFEALRANWAQLDQRDIQAIIDLITEEVPRHLGVNNCLIACCYGKNYLQNAANFSIVIHSIVANNTPADIRPKIKLDMFKVEFLLQQPEPIMFDGIPTAVAVSSAPPAATIVAAPRSSTPSKKLAI